MHHGLQKKIKLRSFSGIGKVREENALIIDLTKYINNGGTVDRMLEIVNQFVDKMGLEGHTRPSQKGQRTIADQPQGDGGRYRDAEKARSILPPPPTLVKTMRQEGRRTARTVLDSFQVRGKPIGDCTLQELIGLRFTNRMENYVIESIQKHAANIDAFEPIRNVVNPGDLQRFIQKGAEYAES